MRTFIVLIILCTSMIACNKPTNETENEPIENALTEQEKTDGWKLLFDGESLDGWKGFKKDTMGTAWTIDDGAIHLDNSQKEGFQAKSGGDIITVDDYENFEFALQWKIQPCGNSGIMFNVIESDDYDYAWNTGPEMQVLDNECHPDAKIIKHRAGDLYDMITSSKETVKKVGEWNDVRIVSDHGKVSFWLNGENVVSFAIDDENWDAMIAGSKFKDMKGFGKAGKGHIALQDHGDKVWFKNIKVKEIAP